MRTAIHTVSGQRWTAGGMAAFLGLAGLLAGGPAARAQEVERFGGTEEITAVDLLVELAELRRDGRSVAVPPPRDLTPADFRLTLDGAAEPIVAVAAAAAGGDTEEWALTLYFDVPLAGSSSVRWAARHLAERLPELTGLGTVSIVVADPEPVVQLGPTRDAERLAEVLFDLEGIAPVSPALETVRSQFLDELHAAEPRFDAAELRAAAEAEELAVARRQLDAMALVMVDASGLESRRAVFWVTEGFDLDPRRFYAEWAGPAGSAGAARIDGAGLADIVDSTAKTLAAYGWIALPVVGPGLETGLVRGLRIGKWRLAGPAHFPYLGVRLERESHRDPEMAEAYVDLGTSLLEQGRADEAEQALRRALFHFSGDPRTATRQAAASAALAESLEALGRGPEALEARAVAVALDPALAESLPVGEVVADRPATALDRVAAATAGTVVRDPEGLAEAIGGLAYRVRVTYQTVGPADGSLRQVDVRFPRGGFTPRAPAWSRSGVPATVAAARARALLQGELIEGELGVELRLQTVQGDGGEERWIAGLDPPPAGETASAYRLTIGVGLPDEAQTVRHEIVSWPPETSAGQGWELTGVDRQGAGAEAWIAVLVEELATGRWGCDLVSAGRRASSASRSPRRSNVRP